MELLEQLELVEVVFEDKKAVMTFLDEERGEIREVNFNKQSYDNETNKFVDDPKKAEKVDGWCEEYFKLPFEKLPEAIGEKRDIYAYDRFNSLFFVEIIEKFTKDYEGQIFETEVVEIEDDGKAIHIKFEFEGKKYESKMSYADYMESKKTWFTNPIKKKKQYDKFETKFGVLVENMQEMVGKKIMCEVKVAFGKFPYVEIKPLIKKKK